MTNLDWWLAFLQSAIMTGVAILLFSIRQAFTGGQTLTRVTERLGTIEKRLDHAGLKMSDYANDLQKLPDQFRSEYYNRTIVDLIKQESAEDRRQLWLALEKLQSQQDSALDRVRREQQQELERLREAVERRRSGRNG